MPSYWLFGAALVVVGVAAQTFTTTANSLVQLSTEPAMRGRVVAILLAIALGGTPIGAPIVGRVADAERPARAERVGAAGGFAAVLVGVYYLAKYGPERNVIHARDCSSTRGQPSSSSAGFRRSTQL
jgi:hypothetical protein